MLRFTHESRKCLKAARKLRRDIKKDTELGLAEFQLVEMHDRLPPLSLFGRAFKLDKWQKDVLRLIDANRSAVRGGAWARAFGLGLGSGLGMGKGSGLRVGSMGRA